MNGLDLLLWLTLGLWLHVGWVKLIRTGGERRPSGRGRYLPNELWPYEEDDLREFDEDELEREDDDEERE